MRIFVKFYAIDSSILSISIVCETAVNMMVMIIMSSSRSSRSRSSRRLCRRLKLALVITTRTTLNYRRPMLAPAMSHMSTPNYRTLAPAPTLTRHLTTTWMLFHNLLSSTLSLVTETAAVWTRFNCAVYRNILTYSVWSAWSHPNVQNSLGTFRRNFPVDGEVANLLWTCCGLVSDTATYLDIVKMSLTSPQQAGNKSL